MDKNIISFDLGAGGKKASLYDVDGNCLASAIGFMKSCCPSLILPPGIKPGSASH
jgi:hypothetical protein